MRETVYKLMQRDDDGVLYSVFALGQFRTAYQEGGRTDRKNLFVFSSLRRAEYHQGIVEGQEVWECETDSEPRYAPDRIPDYDYTGEKGYLGITPEEAINLINAYWEAPYAYYEGPLHMIKPLGDSYLVDDVTLIRRIS